MARIGPTAQRQIDDLATYYWAHDRIEALERFRRAVWEALNQVDDPATCGRSHPANYGRAVSRGVSWLKIHIYWFGYGQAADGAMTISNVIWQGADIPNRIAPFDEMR